MKINVLTYSILLVLVISMAIPTSATLISTKQTNPSLNTVVPFSLSTNNYYDVITNFRFYYPRIGMPAMVLNSSWFEIKFIAPSATTDWQFFLVNDFYNISLAISSSEYTNDYYVFNVTVPSTVEPMLYDLEAKAIVESQTKITIEPHAVSVYNKFPENLKFIHITDTHVRDIWYPANTATQLAIFQINLIRPDFVILSGDVVDYGSSAAFHQFRAMLTMLQVPIFVGPGNHDLDSKSRLSLFETYIAPKNYSVSFGPAQIISLDVSNSWYAPPDQVVWLNQTLSSCDKPFRIVFFHYPPLDNSGNSDLDGAGKELIRVFNEHNVTLVLTGHIHQDMVHVINGTHYVTTTTAGGTYPEGFYHGYRIITYENGTLVGYGYNGNNDRAIPFEQMHVDWSPKPNEIDVGAKVQIVNNLNLNFTANFYVKLEKDVQNSYIVKNATLVNLRDGISTTVAYLLREIKKGESTTIRVYPSNPQAPIINNISYPSSVGDYEAFSITVRINNPISGIERVELHYVLDANAGHIGTTIKMKRSSEGVYTSSFSGFAAGTNFTFYIVAYDYAGLSTTSNEYTIVINETEEHAPTLTDLQLIGIASIAAIALAVAVIFVMKVRKKS